jgi:molybdopterin molybdotransferase
MISFDEAYNIIMGTAFETGTETVSYIGAEGRVLAEDVTSDIDMPPFNRAAVDGYACRLSEIHNELTVVEVIPAGKEPEKKPGPDQCSKIMTGAIVPDGCDIVFMVEDSEELPSGKVRFRGESLKANLSLKGEDVREGDLVLRKGKTIKPQDVAVLASVGHTDVLVRVMPEIGIISTGDELVEPSSKPSLSQIRNSNAYQLLSQVIRAGGKARYYGIAPDTGDSAYDMICRAIAENNIVILTGGVSMGDYDFVPSFLQRAGVKLLFDRINVQPGKPTTFGVHRDAIVFGLPGNPVSSFIQFETLVRPLMAKMTASDWRAPEQNLPMGISYERKSTSRMGWIPVTINASSEVIPVEYHGSAHIASLSYSDGLIRMKPGLKSIQKGEIVTVRYL